MYGLDHIRRWQVLTVMDGVEIVVPTVEELSCQPEKDVPCPEEGCDMVFQTRSSLRMHAVKTHGLMVQEQSESITYGRGGKRKGKVKLFYCPVKDCPRGLNQQKPFNRKASLRQHYFVCHGEKTFVCSKCGRGFGTATTQKRHETVCGQIFHCTCRCPFKSRESLLMHVKRQGHTLPVQYQNLQLTKKQKTTKANQPVLVNILPKCAQSLVSGSSQKPQFILPKPKVMSASQAALLHPENTTLVTVNNGVVTDIKEIRPVQISLRPNLTQTVKLNVKDVFSNKRSADRPRLSDAQAQWSVTDTADWRQDNSTNTHLSEHVADQQVQVIPETLTVGTNFPGLAETDAHTQTNTQPSSRDVNSASTNAQMQVINLGNSMSDALVQTTPLFRVESLASDPSNTSGQNMETQTSSDLLLQAMISAMLQRHDQQPSVVIGGCSPLNYPVPVQQLNPPSGTTTVSQRICPNTVPSGSRASSQTQTQILSTSMNQLNNLTHPQYSNVPQTNQQIIAVPTDQRSLDGRAQGSSSKVNRKRSFESISPSKKSSPENLPFGQYGQRGMNMMLSQEARLQSQEKDVLVSATPNAQQGDYISCLEIGRPTEPQPNAMTMEESSAETNTVGIQAENSIRDNDFSTIDLMDPFPDLGDVFLESIATQTYSDGHFNTFDNFIQGSSRRDLATPDIPEADSWAPASMQKSFMGDSFEELLHTDSGSQTDEFQEFIFENQFIENATKTIAPSYDTEDNRENASTSEESLEQPDALEEIPGIGQMDVYKINITELKENSKLGQSKPSYPDISQTSPEIESGVASNDVPEVGSKTVDLESRKDGNDGSKSSSQTDESPDETSSLSSDNPTIEREEGTPVGVSDVETQADIYPLKRSRFIAVKSNNETQTRLNASATPPDEVVPSGGSPAKPDDVSTTSGQVSEQPANDSTQISSKVNTSEQNIERLSTDVQKGDVPRYCNAEIQADIILINRSKDDAMGSSNVGTTSVETQTKNTNLPTDENKL